MFQVHKNEYIFCNRKGEFYSHFSRTYQQHTGNSLDTSWTLHGHQRDFGENNIKEGMAGKPSNIII
jgi:hypothetical protein